MINQLFMTHDIVNLLDVIREYGDDLSILAYTMVEDSATATLVVLAVLLRLWKSGRLPPANSPAIFTFLHSEIKKGCEPQDLQNSA
jgi:hypothetical protein